MSPEPHAVTRRAQISAAHRAVRKLPRPDGMRAGTWLLLKEVLVALNGHLPDVFPSQRMLAKKVGVSQRYVSDLLVLAEKHGLITRLEKPGRHGERPRHEYRLLYVVPPENTSALDQRTGALGPENWSAPKAVPKREEPRLAALQQVHPSDELAAAAAGPPPPNTSLHPNQFPGPCLACERYVEVGAGTWASDAEGVRRAVHLDCFGKPPGSMTPDEISRREANAVIERWKAAGRPLTPDGFIART